MLAELAWRVLEILVCSAARQSSSSYRSHAPTSLAEVLHALGHHVLHGLLLQGLLSCHERRLLLLLLLLE